MRRCVYSAAFQINDKKLNSIKYEIDRYDRGTDFTGLRSILTHNQNIKRLAVSDDQFSLTTSDSAPVFRDDFWRPSIDISKKFTHLSNYTLGASIIRWRTMRSRDK